MEDIICISDSDEEESGLSALKRLLGNLDKLLEDESKPVKVVKKPKKSHNKRGRRGEVAALHDGNPYYDHYAAARNVNVRDDGTGFGGSQTDDMSHFAHAKQRVQQFDEVLAEIFNSLGFKLKRLEDEQEAKSMMLRSAGLSKALHKFLKNDLLDVCRRNKAYTPILNFLDALARNHVLRDMLTAPLSCKGWVPSSSKGSSNKDAEAGTEADSTRESIASLVADLGRAASNFVKFDKQTGENVDYLSVCLHLEEVQSTIGNAVGHAEPSAQGEAVATSSCSTRTRSAAGKAAAAAAEDWKSAESKAYVAELKKLRFEAVNIVEQIEKNEIGFSFNLDHSDNRSYSRPWMDAFAGPSYKKKPNSAPGVAIKGRSSRIASEIASLASSLPVEYQSSIFVRVDEDRPDVIKALIIGPEDTPYANGCFEFDIMLPLDYPQSPPKVKFLTTGGGRVRFNPNLYEDGKVCLSLLGTWAGPSWKSDTSTLLQVLISIQALILVAEPYWNEPGHESMRKTTHGQKNAQRYDERIQYHTIRHAMLRACQKPSTVFKDVIEKHMVLKRRGILEQLDKVEKQHSEAQKKRDEEAKKAKEAREAAAAKAAASAGGKKGKAMPTHLLHGMHFYGGLLGDFDDDFDHYSRDMDGTKDLPDQIHKLRVALNDLEQGREPQVDPNDFKEPKGVRRQVPMPQSYEALKKKIDDAKKKIQDFEAASAKKLQDLRKKLGEKGGDQAPQAMGAGAGAAPSHSQLAGLGVPSFLTDLAASSSTAGGAAEEGGWAAAATLVLGSGLAGPAYFSIGEGLHGIENQSKWLSSGPQGSNSAHATGAAAAHVESASGHSTSNRKKRRSDTSSSQECIMLDSAEEGPGAGASAKRPRTSRKLDSRVDLTREDPASRCGIEVEQSLDQEAVIILD